MRNKRIVSRKKLYEEVWSTPMSRLAQKYEMSDVGLAKACKRHNIPRPPRGYWAKRYAGIKVKKVALPNPENNTIIEFHNNPIGIYSLLSHDIDFGTEEFVANKPHSKVESPIQNKPEYKEISVERYRFSDNVRNSFPVPSNLKDAHQLVLSSAEILITADLDRENMLIPPESSLHINVSKNSLQRALLIFAGLLSGLEKLGYSLSEIEGKTIVHINRIELRIGMYENVHIVKIPIMDVDEIKRLEFAYKSYRKVEQPSGNLTLSIYERQENWSVNTRCSRTDTKRRKLETLLGWFIEDLINLANYKRVYLSQTEDSKR